MIPDQGSDLPAARWSVAKRVAFRVAFVYLILYNLPFPLYAFWNLSPEESWYGRFWQAAVPWVGRHVLGATVAPPAPGGTGDSPYDYLLVLCYVVLALAATAVWTAVDRHRASHSRLFAWLHVYVRFALALLMVSYGSLKVIKAQFPDPSLSRLVQPFGDASPMGLLWTFMGASQAYNVLTGSIEMLGGLLLTVRRTALLGALVSFGALANILALNLCYDVPVKLLSAHLLAMSVFVMLPNARRLADFFLFYRTVEAAPVRPLIRRPAWRRAVTALVAVAVVGVTGYSLIGAYQLRAAFGDLSPEPPFYGIWNVEELTSGGVVRPPLVTDGSRWRRWIFDRRSFVLIQEMDDHRGRYRMALDSAADSFTLTRIGDESGPSEFRYRQPEPGLLIVEGTVDETPVVARLRKVDPHFLLRERGFHWVSPAPFNR